MEFWKIVHHGSCFLKQLQKWSKRSLCTLKKRFQSRAWFYVCTGNLKPNYPKPSHLHLPQCSIIPLAGQGVEILCKRTCKAPLLMTAYQCPGCPDHPKGNLKRLPHKYFLRAIFFYNR
ncbi:hypothetical protein AV530_015616 [Patagioenas fasciata monilis]|uniref:Uncharacterized protein n=1 Tax=Patagioenas fasciata monilis TaxID=372326 RepID=A0A1V4KI30_PATFA|nr:hypothetical protein AV530_015616 [Patagioenas fasciata monilis]